MKKFRGFKLTKRLIRFSKRVFRRARCHSGYNRLINPPELTCRSRSVSKLISWGRRLTARAKSLCSVKPGSGYVPVGHEGFGEKVTVPKGHLAVYVGQKDGDFHRVLVPVIYFNHPLFGELLKEAEKEYGFHQQGGITIPCQYSEFERVQTRIAAAGAGGKNRNIYYY